MCCRRRTWRRRSGSRRRRISRILRRGCLGWPAIRCRRFAAGSLRERLLFNDELVDLLADELPTATADIDIRQLALRGCLADLSSEQRELILRRYGPGASVQRLAAELKRTVGVISQTLYRIRQTLMQCIRGKLAAESAS